MGVLLKRQSSYYFRWQVPKDLGVILKRREIVKSLCTKDERLAQIRALPLIYVVKKIQSFRKAFKMSGIPQELIGTGSFFDQLEAKKRSNPTLVFVDNNYTNVIQLLWEFGEKNANAQPRVPLRDGVFRQGEVLIKDIIDDDGLDYSFV